MHTFRTMLEQQIKERRQTPEEFVEYAEVFVREHKESGTLSIRHLQRLIAGHGAKGQPLGTLVRQQSDFWKKSLIAALTNYSALQCSPPLLRAGPQS